MNITTIANRMRKAGGLIIKIAESAIEHWPQIVLLVAGGAVGGAVVAERGSDSPIDETKVRQILQAELGQSSQSMEQSLGKLKKNLTAAIESMVEDTMTGHQQITSDFQQLDTSVTAVQASLKQLQDSLNLTDNRLVAQHEDIQERTETVQTKVEEIHEPVHTAKAKIESVQKTVGELLLEFSALTNRLADIPTQAQLTQLRNDVLRDAAEADKSPKVVILRPKETRETSFTILSESEGFAARRYSVSFTAKKIDEACRVEVQVRAAHSGEIKTETVQGLVENQEYKLEKSPFTLRLLYVKNNTFHKDLMVLAVFPNAQAG